MYLRLLVSQSNVSLELCTKFTMDNYEGATLKASIDIEVNKKIFHVIGVSKTIKQEDKNCFVFAKNDFSILHSTRSNTSKLMLGPIALVNHNCNSNCEYLPFSKSTVILKSIRPIKKGDELSVFYGNEYFGFKNKDCQCETCDERRLSQACEQKSKYFFTLMNNFFYF